MEAGVLFTTTRWRHRITLGFIVVWDTPPPPSTTYLSSNCTWLFPLCEFLQICCHFSYFENVPFDPQTSLWHVHSLCTHAYGFQLPATVCVPALLLQEDGARIQLFHFEGQRFIRRGGGGAFVPGVAVTGLLVSSATTSATNPTVRIFL